MARTALQIAQAKPTETYEQQSLFAWAELRLVKYPELEDMFAVPNGAHKSQREAAKFQREGLKSGVPDVVLPHARHGFHALYIEMKRQKTIGPRGGEGIKHGVTDTQAKWHRRLQEAGNCVRVAYGWEEARAILEWYLGPNEKPPSV